MTEGHRTLLTVADDLDLACHHSLNHQEFAHGIGTTLAQGHIVFTAAAFITMSLDGDTGGRMIGQIGGMGCDDVTELAFDVALVEIKVHHTLGQQTVGIRSC